MVDEGRIEKAAQAAHEVNRVFCREVLDDNSHMLWKDTPDNIRDSVRSGVRAIVDDPGLTPAMSHEKWMDYKLSEGWVYGERKDLAAKTHPCLVPFTQLPLGDRVKDTLFGVVVRAALGLEHHVAVDSYATSDEVKTDPGRGQLGQ